MELSVKQGLGGEAALPKLLGIDPAVKAVAVLSNYDASKQHDFNKRGFAAALGKPFRLDDVRRILQGLFAA